MSKRSVFHLSPQQFHRLLDLATGDPPLPAEQSPEAPEAVESANRPDEALGSWIGRYRLIRVLGEGGMGIVYLAEQEHPLKRQVALKVIKPGMDSKRVTARFETERQALALLDNPNIAQVYDAGTTDAGRPYFVMEHVKGLPITEYCDRHKLTIDERLRLFQQVSLAVHHAHQKGIIHRDVKPSNVLVSAENDRPIPKIIDFGVAKAISQPLTERTLVTEDSHLLGTPEYMSPEQAEMVNEDIDTRSDIYSLGVLLYELLAGISPYDSETFRQGGIEHIRKTIRETDPKTPSTRLTKLGEEAQKLAESRRTEVAALAKRLHTELEWIPLKAMRKERAERYRSASELADDIENYLQGEPLLAGPPGRGYKLKKFVRRNRVLVGGIAAVLVVLVAGVVVSTTFAIGQARARAEAQAVADFLRNDLLASVDPIKAKGRELTVRSFLDTASENLKGKFSREPLVEASIRDTLGWTYRMLGELKAAGPHLERTLQIRQEQFGPEHPETLAAMGRLGWVYCDQGRYREAEPLWSKRLEVNRRVLGNEDRTTLECMKDLGYAYMNLGRYDEAERLYSTTVQTSRRVLGEPDVMGIGHLGMLYRRQGRYGEAEALCLTHLEISRRKLGDENPFTLWYMTMLAEVYRQQGRYTESESLYLKTLEVERRVLGEEHPYTLGSIEGLAQLYTDEGRYDEAEQRSVKALAARRRVLGDEHPDTLRNVNGLGVLRTKQRQYEQAEHLFDEASKGRQRELGDDHPDTLETTNDFGVLRREQQRYDEAESLLRQALEGRQRKLSPDRPACFESMHELALVYIRQARYQDAEPLLLDAFHGRQTKLGPEHPDTIESLKQLVTLYESWPKPDEAAHWRARLAEIKANAE